MSIPVVSMNDLDEGLLMMIVMFAVAVSMEFRPVVQTRKGPSTQVETHHAGDTLRRVNRQFRDLIGRLKRSALMPSLCACRDAFFEHVVGCAMHCIVHDRARDLGESYVMFFTMHMNGDQIQLEAGMCSENDDECSLLIIFRFYPACVQMFDDNADASTRFEYLHASVPNAFQEPVATRSPAQVEELADWTREYTPALVAELKKAVERRSRKVVGRVPCLLSDTSLSGNNVLLRVRYSFAGDMFMLMKVYDSWKNLWDCLLEMFADKEDINLDEYQFFAHTGKEETMTDGNGNPVKLIMLTGGDGMYLNENIYVYPLTMTRRA